jgi:hypothetical protein
VTVPPLRHAKRVSLPVVPDARGERHAGALGSGRAVPRGNFRAEHWPAADTGERGPFVVGVALYSSPVRLRPGVRTHRDAYGKFKIHASSNRGGERVKGRR